MKARSLVALWSVAVSSAALSSAALPSAALSLVLLLGACERAPATGSGAGERAVAAAPVVPLARAEAPAPAAASPSGARGALAPTAPAAAAPDDVPRVHVRAEGQLGPGNNILFIDVAPPEGAKLTLESPVSVRGSGGIGLRFPRRLSGSLGDHPMPLRLPIEVADGATGPAELEVTYYWCTDGNEAACRREQARLNVELDLSGAAAGGEAHLSYRARGDRS